jgi:MarR family transcriptional regulator, transcriptional regulator for hemolysin
MDHQSTATSPMRLIGQAFRSFTRVVDGELRAEGFATGQLPVLGALKRGNALSQADLAREACVEQPSMAQLLNRMERDGLVERNPDPQDRRVQLISLTAQAARRMPRAKAVLEARTADALSGFSAGEVAQLTALLRRLNDNIDRMNAERNDG